MLRKFYGLTIGKNSIHGLLESHLNNGEVVLDAGCGRKSNLRLVKKRLTTVGLDHYKPYLKESRKKSLHDKYVLGDVRRMPFEDKSFDVVVSVEVLEHMPKKDGLKMLKEMERVARRIVLTTPNGFLPTYPRVDDNPDEAHLCGWSVSELESLGFRVMGCNGVRFLWKVECGMSVMRFRPRVLCRVLSDLLGFVSFHFPRCAFQLFCVKECR